MVDSSLVLSPAQTLLCLRVLNVFETGRVEGRYDAISIYHDGPGKIRQITYGAKQTTEYGKLRTLVAMYVEAKGSRAAELKPYLAKIGKTALTDDEAFKTLLAEAGRDDPVMRGVQDDFFRRHYFQPAFDWAASHGFTRALSFLVIFDSFIHSGSIRTDLRNRFPERTPSNGGREEVWIAQYTAIRHQWLSNHSNPDVRPSAYRTKDLLREIEAGNWDLNKLPFMANGTPVIAEGISPVAEERVWSEAEPPASGAFAVDGKSAAALAADILQNPAIELATTHSQGPVDNAVARQNLVDTSQGGPAHRSTYGTAPGGTVHLSTAMLAGMIDLAKEFRFAVSEFCGGNHNTGSRHYAGVAADIWQIDGQRVNETHPLQAKFRDRCRHLGATEILGPPDEGHKTHIHAAWPRP